MKWGILLLSHQPMGIGSTYMLRCLQLAEKGKADVSPNPMVGAVLVYNDKIISEGWHRKYGMAHAEVDCLDNVPQQLRDLIPESTMYVSLEPCAHHGKTPPCALRLVSEKVREVVVCNNDPFEQVQGKGFDILKKSGVGIQQGLLEAEGLWLNRRFFCFHQKQRPYIILKWAQTQQSFFAPLNRTRHQMSNKHSQQLVHKWRTEESAIMVGYNTALHDDPQLTARHWDGPQPLRIVLDEQLQLPQHLRLMQEDADTWIINPVKDEQRGHLSYVKLNFDDSLLAQLLEKLYAERKLSLIVEGGAHLLNTFIRQGLWDEARVFETPNVLSEGIVAPALTNASHAFTSQVETDSLQLYTRADTAYPYIPGMAL